MDQLIPVLMIVGMVAFVMIRQIGKITGGIETKRTGSFEKYANFSSIIQEYVREIKASVDTSKEREDRKFKLVEGRNENQALEKLSDFIRKLVFFETMMAKQKNQKEIEAELFEVLNGLEIFLKEFCEDGENLSEELREKLLEAYEQL